MHTLGEIQPGQTLGRYELLLPIAQGGMAAIWAARLKGTRGFSKTVAVKTMLPTISDDPLFEQMFLDEARIASRIKHPNVAEILDLGEQDDVLYLVMEWVDGEPLSTIRRVAAKQRGFGRPIAVKIVAEVAAGLHAAHELEDEHGAPLGLVHRDISPQNVLITYDGAVKIVDFGVAKSAGRTSQESDAGQIKGKPPYMSPEQALGNDIDRRTDVFALGIILYQLTTGRHPFRGETDMVTLQNIVSDRPIIAPRAYDKDYPKSLENVVLTALERDLDKRYQTARAFEQALERVFPPTVRVRSEDISNFLQNLLGNRANERRAALREAIRQADERSAWDAGSSPDELRTYSGRGSVPGARRSEPPIRRSQPPSVRSNFPSQRPGAPSQPPGARRATPEIAAALFAPTPVTSPEFGSIDRLLDGGAAAESDSALHASGSPAPTPYATQTPSRPAPPAKSRGALFVVLGVALVAFAVGSAVLVSRTRSSSSAGELGAPAGPMAAPVAPLVAPKETAEPSPAPKLDEPTVDGAAPIASAAPAPEPRHAAQEKRPSSQERTPESAAKREEKKPEAPKPSKPSDFEPPPVSDPGF